MRYSGPEKEGGRPQHLPAAVFIDYENLYGLLYHRVGQRGHPDEFINEILEELRRYLQEEFHIPSARMAAYADFTDLRGNGQFVQRALYMQGIETRFVPASLQRNAAEIQLCVDAVEELHAGLDAGTFVIVTGDRAFLPLVQLFKRHGYQTLVVTLQPPGSTASLPHVEDDVFLNALNLLSDATRRTLLSDSASPSRPRNGQPSSTPERPEPVTYSRITSVGGQRTLQIIEEFFGQYEEVYLTPLLRKLSEVLDENRYDPKSLISELEDAGAIWLEKRRGFPYDYTVLIVDSEHPDVKEVQEQFYDQHRDAEYEDDTYEEDVYFEDEDDYGEEYEDAYEEDTFEEDTFEEDADTPPYDGYEDDALEDEDAEAEERL